MNWRNWVTELAVGTIIAEGDQYRIVANGSTNVDLYGRFVDPFATVYYDLAHEDEFKAEGVAKNLLMESLMRDYLKEEGVVSFPARVTGTMSFSTLDDGKVIAHGFAPNTEGVLRFQPHHTPANAEAKVMPKGSPIVAFDRVYILGDPTLIGTVTNVELGDPFGDDDNPGDRIFVQIDGSGSDVFTRSQVKRLDKVGS